MIINSFNQNVRQNPASFKANLAMPQITKNQIVRDMEKNDPFRVRRPLLTLPGEFENRTASTDGIFILTPILNNKSALNVRLANYEGETIENSHGVKMIGEISLQNIIDRRTKVKDLVNNLATVLEDLNTKKN